MRAQALFRATPLPVRGLLSPPVAQPRDALGAAILRWTVLLLPLNWVCGTTPFWCYGAALLLLFRSRTFCVLEVLFAWLMAALTLGLVVGVARGAPLDRAVASVYNLTILVVMLAFLNGAAALAGPAAEARRGAITRAALIVFGLNVVLITVVFVLTKATGDYDLAMRSLVLGLVGPLPGVFGEYGHVDFAVTDWTVGGPETRVIGFGIYATEGALLFLLTGLLGAIEAFRRRSLALVGAIEALIAVGLVIMASRTTLGAYLFSTVLLAPLQRTRLAKLAVVLLPVLVIGGFAVATFGGDAVSQWLAARNEARLGSSDTRFLSYATAFAMVMAQNPLTGLGIKPVDPSIILVPIGSHSTLSSMFAKGGIIGILVTAAIFVTLLAGVVRAQLLLWRGAALQLDRVGRFELIQLSRCVLVVLIWWTTEDLDAPAHEAAFAGLCFGLFWVMLRRAAARSP